MRNGMCNLSVVPLRLEPSHKSEMVSQLLFGELFSITERTENWAKIITDYDNYEGWINTGQFLPLYNETYEKLRDFGSVLTLDIMQILVNETNDSAIPVVLGSTFPFVANNIFYINDQKYSFNGNFRPDKEEVKKETIAEMAFLYLDAPYLWGGRTPFGIDCSGLVQMAYKLSGIKLPRDSGQQAAEGSLVNFLSEAVSGDLAFFDNDEGAIVHTGIILSNNQVIHASGCVRIDTLDHEGIYNQTLKKYTHKLRLIKKII